MRRWRRRFWARWACTIELQRMPKSAKRMKAMERAAGLPVDGLRRRLAK